ncbi:hypothetical protein LSAT2_010542 [Lamellibrachia satsuma]|nr:hypothetical protein LSAT2_010542 [Lamellibrachia satsuma]
MDEQLLSAAEDGDIWTVGKILKKCPDVNVNVVNENYKDSALALACKGGHYGIAKMMIESGAKVNAANSLGVTPYIGQQRVITPK